MLRQKHYIENILKRFKLEGEKSYQTPMLPNTQLRSVIDQSPEEERAMEKIPYMNMVGALRYAADATRPDIAYVTGQLARHLQKYGLEHYNAAKHCMQYLKGTKELWLVLGGIEFTHITGYTDADGMATEGHKAILAYIFQLARASLSWSSRRGDLVPASVYEGEIQALFQGAKEAIWLKRFTHEVLGISNDPIMLHCDNQAAIKTVLSEEMTFNAKTKHLDRRKDFIRDYIKEKYIDVKYVPTHDQRADILTKALYTPQIKHLTDLLGLVRV